MFIKFMSQYAIEIISSTKRKLHSENLSNYTIQSHKRVNAKT